MRLKSLAGAVVGILFMSSFVGASPTPKNWGSDTYDFSAIFFARGSSTAFARNVSSNVSSTENESARIQGNLEAPEARGVPETGLLLLLGGGLLAVASGARRHYRRQPSA